MTSNRVLRISLTVHHNAGVAQVDTDSKNRIVEIVTANDKSRKPIPKDDWF